MAAPNNNWKERLKDWYHIGCAFPRRYIGRVLNYYYASRGKVVVSTHNPKVFDLAKQIHKEVEMFQNDFAVYQIYTAVKKTNEIKGEVAEVGVYKGGTAKVICEATNKPIHLFDTFEGLPDLCEKDDPNQFQKGDTFVSLESVKSYLKNYSNVYFYKGLFPLSAEPLKDKRFSFVHFDVDLYQSALDCLKFFYPRMSKKGIILSHDYPSSKGVVKAFEEFFNDKPETVIEVLDCDQCLIYKV